MELASSYTLLIIDDEDQVRLLAQMVLEDVGYRVLISESGQHGLRLLQRQEVDLILVDIFMPGMDGLEVIKRVRTTRPACRIIAMSGGSEEWDHLDVAKYLGADATLRKPLSVHELLDAVSAQLTSSHP